MRGLSTTQLEKWSLLPSSFNGYLSLRHEGLELYSIFELFFIKIKTQFNISTCVFCFDNSRKCYLREFFQVFSDYVIIQQSYYARTL